MGALSPIPPPSPIVLKFSSQFSKFSISIYFPHFVRYPTSMSRNSGYYWIKYRGEWKPAHYSSRMDMWSLIGYDGPVDEDELDTVGEELEH